ncbi:hypothetical protein EBR25_01920 [bacterium]|nr:hypothetical protein [bacterium]
MSIASDEQQYGESDFRAWDPLTELSAVSAEDIRFSRGFLRSQPEVWFPGFTAHWLPLFHTFDIHHEKCGTTPLIDLDAGEGVAFHGSLDGETVSLFIPRSLSECITRTQAPAASLTAKHLMIEYFARRFMTSLASSWSANEGGVFRFQSDVSAPSEACVGGVRLDFRLNGEELSLVIGISQGLMDRLDQLWITQILKGIPSAEERARVRVVFGSTAFLPSEVGDSLVPGKTLPINFGGSDSVVLLMDEQPWLEGSLFTHDDQLVFQARGEANEGIANADGMTSVTFELEEIELSKAESALLSQPGALHKLASSAKQPKIHISVAHKKVGHGILVAYESQLFVKVIGEQ